MRHGDLLVQGIGALLPPMDFRLNPGRDLLVNFGPRFLDWTWDLIIQLGQAVDAALLCSTRLFHAFSMNSGNSVHGHSQNIPKPTAYLCVCTGMSRPFETVARHRKSRDLWATRGLCATSIDPLDFATLGASASKMHYAPLLALRRRLGTLGT